MNFSLSESDEPAIPSEKTYKLLYYLSGEMKHAFLIIRIFTIVLLAMSVHAQEPSQKKESYKSLKSRSSRTQIEQLLQEANEFKLSNPSQALNHVQEALGMSIAQNDGFNEAKCYLLLGEINENIQEWGLALDNFDRAYQKLFANYTQSTEYQRTLRGLGNTYLKLGNYPLALKYYQEVIQLPLGEVEKAERQIDLSEVYYQMGNYKEALKVIEETRNASKIRNHALEGKIQNQKAKIYARLNNVDKANDFYQSSQQNLRAANTSPRQDQEDELAVQSSNAKEEISGALREQKRYDEDIALRKQSIESNIESNNLGEVSKDKIELSKSLVAKGETLSAIRELEEAAVLADTINNPKKQATAYLQLADLYEKNGMPSKALSIFKKYSEAIIRTEKQNEFALQEKADLIKKQKEIEALSNRVVLGQQEEQTTLQQQQLIIYGLLVIIAITMVTSYFIFKNAQASKRANQLLALKSLRSQMNPHFIFNALNSVNHFISQNDERTANKFLSEFSRLMRLVLENSQEDFIPLHKEEEIISLYIKLEHYRFRDKFDYQVRVDEDLNKETIELPPMLIQPYIENAVWHGLRYKESKGSLDIHIGKDIRGLKIEVTDNGIGRKKSAALKTENQKKHNSTGLKNIQERLNILNTVYKTNYQVQIEDLPSDSGTRVTISVPIQNGMI
jgi:tetratricopeptide (TPR) repeat protein